MDTKKLRQKILDLAIHGKLVPQDPNDEPASVLLERIRAEKEKLIKEGKIKAPKKSKSAGDTSHYPKDVPFEVPEGWCWTTIEDISNSILYGVNEPSKASGNYKLLRITDIQKGKVDWETVPFTDYDDKKADQYLLSDGDILFARTGATVGKSYLASNAPSNAIYASYLIRVRYSNLMCPQYVKFFFESGYYWEQISSSSVGVGQPNVNGASLGKLIIPIPPVAEQIRVAKEANKLLCIIDDLDYKAESLENDIVAAKSKILDLAVRGRLVSQNPSDEPAIELLKRINPDFVPSHNLHYEGELPQGWCVVRLGSIIEIISGTSFQKGDIVSPANNGIRILRGGNIQKGNIVLYENDVFVNEGLSNQNNTIHRGDIAIVASTGSSELIGKAAIAKYDYPNTQIGAFMRIIRPTLTDLSDYLGILFQSNIYKNHIRDVAKGTNINNIKSSYLTDFVISVPPLEEQHRIIERISELFSVVDNISNSTINDSK